MTEGFQLLFGLAHVGVEKTEIAQIPDSVSGININRIPTFMNLHCHQYILAVGGIVETPVVVDGEVTVRPRMRITMSCDHRVVDGAQGARFLQTLQGMLEEPTAILL